MHIGKGLLRLGKKVIELLPTVDVHWVGYIFMTRYDVGEYFQRLQDRTTPAERLNEYKMWTVILMQELKDNDSHLFEKSSFKIQCV